MNLFKGARARIAAVGLTIVALFVGVGITAAPASAAAQDYGCTITGAVRTGSATYGSSSLYRATGGSLRVPPAKPDYYAGKPCIGDSQNAYVVFSLTASPGKTIQALIYSVEGGAAGVRGFNELNGGAPIQAYGNSTQGVTRMAAIRRTENIRIYNVTGGVLGSYFTLCSGTLAPVAGTPRCTS